MISGALQGLSSGSRQIPDVLEVFQERFMGSHGVSRDVRSDPGFSGML